MALKVGIVGAGGIAHCHGRAAREAPEAELAAICDVSEDALDRFGGTFGVSGRYTDLERMLDGRRDRHPLHLYLGKLPRRHRHTGRADGQGQGDSVRKAHQLDGGRMRGHDRSGAG